jgi:hypothetical protein
MRIEIFEEDDDSSLMFEDEYTEYTIAVDPGSKTYQSKMSRKDDVYYRTQKFEYRICTTPVRVEVRLLERLDEPPPDRYAVKDGVVLESEILARSRDILASMTKRFIADLKKEVEWRGVWVGDPVSMYLLSKHSDIISPDDYRRYLRQLSEKIKIGTQKVEQALESDEMGLQVTDEYEDSGRTIWYPMEKQDQMSDNEIKKALEHHHKIQKRLFDEKSKEYVGISESEFKNGKKILEHIETFLNKNPAAAKKHDSQKVSFGIKFCAFIIQWFLLFIVVSIALWLLSLIVTNLAFVFIVSGILAFFLIFRRSNK